MLEWLSAIGSFGQFVVVFAAATFALGQIRQIRRQADLQSLESFIRFVHSEDFEALVNALRHLRSEGYEAWSDPARWESADFRRVIRFAFMGNTIGILISEGLISENLIVPAFRPQFLQAWEVLGPWLAVQRHGGEASVPYLPAFESVVVRATADRFRNRVAQLRAALPPKLRPRFDESNARIRALYVASQATSDTEP
jgi:hypothetical protein